MNSFKLKGTKTGAAIIEISSSTSAISLIRPGTDDSQTSLPPTDVGLQPWLQVLGGFFLMFNSWGLIVSHGAFQTYFTTGHGVSDQSSPSIIAWIGSIQVFLFLFGGAVTGKYFDAGYFRQMVLVGTFMVVFGLMMTSLASTYYQFMLAQGLCVGGGMSLFLVASAGMPSTWFSRRRSIAVGLVTTGSPIAGIVYPVLLNSLIPRLGFPWAVRILAFISLTTLSISLCLLRMRHPPRQRTSLLEYRALQEPAFAFYTFGIFLTFLGWFNYYDFVEEWAIGTRLNTKGLPVFYILPIVNAASTVGRIIPNLIADRIGPMNVQSVCIIVSGVMVLVWIPTHSIGPLLTISIFYGFFSGALVSLPPTVVASMTLDMTSFGSRVGIVFLAMSFSSLIGPPAAGAIVERGPSGYDGARIFSGVTMLVGATFVVIARMIQARWQWRANV